MMLYLQPSQSIKSANEDIKSCVVELSAARKELLSKYIIETLIGLLYC